MTAALTPPIALDYLRQLSTDIRAAVVLEPAGQPLAGDASIAPAARELVALADRKAGHEGADVSAPGARESVVVVTDAGVAVAAVSNGTAIVVAAGRFALPSLLAHDVETAVAALVGTSYPSAAEHRDRAAESGPEAVRAASALLAAAGLGD